MQIPTKPPCRDSNPEADYRLSATVEKTHTQTRFLYFLKKICGIVCACKTHWHDDSVLWVVAGHCYVVSKVLKVLACSSIKIPPFLTRSNAKKSSPRLHKYSKRNNLLKFSNCKGCDLFKYTCCMFHSGSIGTVFFYTQAAHDHDVFSISQLNAAPNKLISALLRVWISCNMQLVMRSAYKPAVANKREALRTSCEEIKKLILAKLLILPNT